MACLWAASREPSLSRLARPLSSPADSPRWAPSIPCGIRRLLGSGSSVSRVRFVDQIGHSEDAGIRRMENLFADLADAELRRPGELLNMVTTDPDKLRSSSADRTGSGATSSAGGEQPSWKRRVGRDRSGGQGRRERIGGARTSVADAERDGADAASFPDRRCLPHSHKTELQLLRRAGGVSVVPRGFATTQDARYCLRCCYPHG